MTWLNRKRSGRMHLSVRSSRLTDALFTALLAIALLSGGAYARGGDLDTTFSGDGRQLVNFGANDKAREVLRQADGKLVLVGTSELGGRSRLAVARLNANGSLDQSFSGDGRVVTDPTTAVDGVVAAALQPDGKIVVLGRRQDAMTDAVLGYSLTRYLSNGALDTAFGKNGVVIGSFGVSGAQFVDDLSFYTSKCVPSRISGCVSVSRITVLGASGSQIRLVRHTLSGSVDRSFGPPPQENARTNDAGNTPALATQRDGKLVVVSNALSRGQAALLLIRYNWDGSLDGGFGRGGRVEDPFGPDGYVAANALLVQSDGRIAVGGLAFSQGVDVNDYAVVRYLSNGARDRSFGTGGKTFTDINGDDIVFDIAQQPDGKLVLAGRSGGGPVNPIPDGPASFSLARYTTRGSLDSTFGRGGKLLTHFPVKADGRSVGVGGDRIIVAGFGNTEAQSDFAVARYLIR